MCHTHAVECKHLFFFFFQVRSAALFNGNQWMPFWQQLLMQSLFRAHNWWTRQRGGMAFSLWLSRLIPWHLALWKNCIFTATWQKSTSAFFLISFILRDCLDHPYGLAPSPLGPEPTKRGTICVVKQKKNKSGILGGNIEEDVKGGILWESDFLMSCLQIVGSLEVTLWQPHKGKKCHAFPCLTASKSYRMQTKMCSSQYTSLKCAALNTL